MNSASLLDFINNVNVVIQDFREYQIKLDKAEGHSFRLFRFFREDETGLTRILADFLNQKGSHGQADIFIRYFLENIKWRPPEFRNVTVRTEVPIRHDGRPTGRLDLLIEFGSRTALVIENKPYADEGDEQIKRYATYMAERFAHWHLVFLSNDGRAPNSIQRDEWTKLIESNSASTMSYSGSEPGPSLKKWLDQCSRVPDLPENVRFFVTELAKYLEDRFGIAREDMMSEVNRLARMVLDDPGRYLEAAIVTSDAIAAIKKEVYARFLRRLVEKLRHEIGTDWVVTDPQLFEESRWNLFIRRPNWKPGIGICLQKYARPLQVGFCAPAKNAKDREREGASAVTEGTRAVISRKIEVVTGESRVRWLVAGIF